MVLLFLTQKSWQLVLACMNFPGSTGNVSDLRLKGCVVKSESPEALRRINVSLEGGGGVLKGPNTW